MDEHIIDPHAAMAHDTVINSADALDSIDLLKHVGVPDLTDSRLLSEEADGGDDSPDTHGSRTPIPTIDRPDLDEATQQAIAFAQNEYNTRDRGVKRPSSELLTTPDIDMPNAAAISKSKYTKRQNNRAPKVQKPGFKKRKLDSLKDAGSGTAATERRSSTPSRPKWKSDSAMSRTTPQAMEVSAAGDSDGDDSVDNNQEIYCICRKPDNHTWMIGCDGGCEDWFHGKCVNIKKEDEELIDRYICPNCMDKDRGVTTWKPMCRREGCRKPARLKKGAESKYCSDRCGLGFMNRVLLASKLKMPLNPRQECLEAEDLGPLGGALRFPEIKALALAVQDASNFRRLGSEALPTPPQSDPDEVIETRKIEHAEDMNLLTDEEQMKLGAILERKTELRDRRSLLKEREKFFTMIKKRNMALAEAVRIKDICGFDPRLTWDDHAFSEWQRSEDGAKALQEGSLGPLPEPVNIGSDDSPSRLCLKRRCQRHKEWQKVMLQDVRFEEAEVGDEMRRVATEEAAFREHALRWSGLQQINDTTVEVLMGGTEGVSSNVATTTTPVNPNNLVVKSEPDPDLGMIPETMVT